MSIFKNSGQDNSFQMSDSNATEQYPEGDLIEEWNIDNCGYFVRVWVQIFSQTSLDLEIFFKLGRGPRTTMKAGFNKVTI